jgi:hypothetical protein
MRPNEIFAILYSGKVFGLSIFHAVLLQELLINVSVFMSTFPVSLKLYLTYRSTLLFIATF